MGNRFVAVTNDSFKNRTTAESITADYKLDARDLLLRETVTFNFRQISEPELNALVIDVHFVSSRANPKGSSLSTMTHPGEWAFLRNGQLILRINDRENIPLTPHERDSNVSTTDIVGTTAVEEQLYYEIDKDILEKISSAETLQMQLSGGRACWTLDGSIVISIAKAMWDALYDNRYAGEVEHLEKVSDEQGRIKKIGCLSMIVSAVIGFILVASIESEVGSVLGAVFVIVIPIIIFVTYRIKMNKVN